MSDCKPVNTPIASGVKLNVTNSEGINDLVPYRELVGGIMYLALGTKSDIAHAVSVLSQFNCIHEKKHWTAAKHVLRYLRGTIDLTLQFKHTDKSPRIHGC